MRSGGVPVPVGFVMMHQVVIGRIVLLCVWVFHLVYFTFGVKTFQGESTEKRPE